MSTILAPLAATFLSVSAQPAPAALSPPPAGRWIADFGDVRCSLVRQAGDGSFAAVTLVPGTGVVDLRLNGKGWDSATVRPGEDVEVELAPGGMKVSRPAREIPLTSGEAVALTGVEKAFLDALAASSAIRLNARGQRLLEVRLSGAAKAVATIRQCEEAMMKEWGADSAAQAALQRRAVAKGTLTAIVQDSDYPVSAMRAGNQGTVTVMLTVAKEGRVRMCTVVGSSGHADLDSTACRILRTRATFEPAIGADGAAAEDYVVTSITWLVS
jgi:TonB family protein